MATVKQRLAVKNLAENGGNVSKAMRDAGYSAMTATTPKKLTERKGFQELMDEFLGDALLAKKHNELLNKQEIVIKSTKDGFEAVPTGQIDANATAKGLDMAYKLKNRYGHDERKTGDMNIQIIINNEKTRKNLDDFIFDE